MSRHRKTAKENKSDDRHVRCAIYTRKSSEEGLDLEFNSLDAQRESGEAFIASQKAEGWHTLPEQYNDGGFSGGSMERPAVKRLLADIEAGKIDCVVVYKVDRLSRSLMDFSRIIETFDRLGVSFVSVTQQFNTTHSMGRLTLNILLSFAQFEREIIGERIRDKIAAQRRRGKWAGGVPVLGYDVDRSNPSPRLVVNANEAARVRAIYQMYVDKGSLLPVVKELDRKGWANKLRVTKKGKTVGGRAFDKASLHQMLTNLVYTGKITHKDQVYDGEHEAIVDDKMFATVQKQLKHNGRSGGAEVRNKYGALLRGLLQCKTCGCAMTHTFARGRKGKCYRYYRCTNAIKKGHGKCSGGNVPAAEMERVVVDEVRGLASDNALLKQVLAEAMAVTDAEAAGLARERAELTSQLDRHHKELRRLAAKQIRTRTDVDRIADLHEQISAAERRRADIDAAIEKLDRQTITRADAQSAFAKFETVWERLIPREQARLLNLLIASVDYDGTAGTMSVTFRPTSIQTLIHHQREEAA